MFVINLHCLLVCCHVFDHFDRALIVNLYLRRFGCCEVDRVLAELDGGGISIHQTDLTEELSGPQRFLGG